MTKFAYPENIMRVIGPQIRNATRALMHHYRNRHKYGNQPAKNWLAEVRRIDAASGCSIALQQINEAKNGR